MNSQISRCLCVSIDFAPPWDANVCSYQEGSAGIGRRQDRRGEALTSVPHARVRWRGLEPPRAYGPQGPQPCASTNSATSAGERHCSGAPEAAFPGKKVTAPAVLWIARQVKGARDVRKLDHLSRLGEGAAQRTDGDLTAVPVSEGPGRRARELA